MQNKSRWSHRLPSPAAVFPIARPRSPANVLFVRPSRIRQRLRQNQPACFSCQYYPTALMPAHAAQAGLDALWLDTEHNTWDRRELQRMIALYHLANVDCIVRTGTRLAADLYHFLEDGASALLIPLVNTAADAEALVRATKFPPLGERGLDGSGIDNRFYLKGTDGYPAVANDETLLIVQIETPEALDNVEAIAAVPGVDGLFIGPGDLALRLGCPLDWSHPSMQAAQARVATAAARHNVAWGRPAGTVEDMRKLAAAGARLINHGSDFGAIMAMMSQYGRNVAEALNGLR